jgi:hypothetical protein
MTKKPIILIITGILLTASLIGGIILVKQQQDVRKEAKVEWCCHCPDNSCPCCEGCPEHNGDGCYKIVSDDDNGDSPTCGDNQCESGGTCYDDGYCCATNKDTGKEYHCCSGTWVEEGTPCGDDSDDCTGWCDRHGCNNDCSGVWPVSFYCRGRSHSACNEKHGSFLGNGIPAGSIKYGEEVKVKKDGKETFISSWCTTVQADTNAPQGDGAIVVFIGDRGEYCVEGTGCNPDDLDWDCSRPTETPTPTETPAPLDCGEIGCKDDEDCSGDHVCTFAYPGVAVYICSIPDPEPECTDNPNEDNCCTRPEDTPTPTPTETPTPTITPTGTPVYDCDCTEVEIYNKNWMLIVNRASGLLVDPSEIYNKEVYLVVRGQTSHPDGLTKARFRVDGGGWMETTDKNDKGFYLPYTFAKYDSFRVEAEVYNPHFGWK